MKNVKRGEIYYADLPSVKGSEQGGIRPVLIVQNKAGNIYSPTTIVVTLTTKVDKKKDLPTHVRLYKKDIPGLSMDSIVQCEQIKTIDKGRIKDKIGEITGDHINKIMEQVNQALKISLEL